MSSKRQFEKALRKAKSRDRKRQTKMKVSGKGVLNLQKIINQPRPK